MPFEFKFSLDEDDSNKQGTAKVWTWTDRGKTAQVRLRTDTLFVAVNGKQISPKTKSTPTRVEIKFDYAGDAFCIIGDRGASSKAPMVFTLTVNGSDRGVAEGSDCS